MDARPPATDVERSATLTISSAGRDDSAKNHMHH